MHFDWQCDVRIVGVPAGFEKDFLDSIQNVSDVALQALHSGAEKIGSQSTDDSEAGGIDDGLRFPHPPSGSVALNLRHAIVRTDRRAIRMSIYSCRRITVRVESSDYKNTEVGRSLRNESCRLNDD